ncbi:MAG: hypothetical protein GXY92_02665 [Syntrophomonadaceae bacterium]|nr:hypothetical protein [Syntrophomonadaceae bacterium]
MEPNIVNPHEKPAAVQPLQRKRYFTVVFVFLLFIIIGGLGAMVYFQAETNRFMSLLEQGKYGEAIDCYRHAAGFLPGGSEKWLKGRFEEALEIRLGEMVEDYLADRVEYSEVAACLLVASQTSLAPGHFEKYRALVEAERASRFSDEHRAISIVEEALEDYPGDALLTAQLARYQKRAADLVLYDGPVQHIFFHPLIVYPEQAFDNDRMSKGLNEFMITVREFNLILESLYERDYILIDIHEIFEERTNNGRTELVRKELWLPKNKKPLILSIDDLNYYPYMKENGMNHKLVLDRDGNVAAFLISPEGKEIIAYDTEIVPILDEFVAEHPDFSYKGAKGIIALTGFNGVLGYQTHAISSPSYNAEKEQALAVIKSLKETGWSFASHGYGHIDTARRSLSDLIEDTKKWKAEVESLIGPTDVYIYPYGSTVPVTDPRFKYLQQSGFKVFCGVGPREYLRYYPDSLVMDRRHIDGIAFWKQPETLTDLFNVRGIIDPVRPPL